MVIRDEAGIEEAIKALGTLDLVGLRAVWSQRFGPPPKLRSVELLRLMLAWRIQACALGGLDAATRQQLDRRGARPREGRKLGLGAVLHRSWHGRRIEAVVEAGGFRCEGVLHPSLSALALAVTGTRWNGPRFFGLRQEPGGPCPPSRASRARDKAARQEARP
jgi:hypothetical protein